MFNFDGPVMAPQAQVCETLPVFVGQTEERYGGTNVEQDVGM